MLKVNTEKSGEVTALHFRGRIVNGGATTTLREAVLAQVSARAVILDLAQVDLIDAGGLGALLELRRWAKSNGIDFRLINVTRPVKQVLELTRLDSVFQISSRESVRSAAACVRPSAVGRKSAAVCCEA